MRVTIYGAGYVGLVTSICLAELGHIICCVDVNQNKIVQLQSGQLPIYEENLAELLKKNIAKHRLHFTSDFSVAVHFSALQMIAVGTPSRADGSADLQYVQNVVEKIGKLATQDCCVVNKSTVPAGTARWVKENIAKKFLDRGVNFICDVASNPEFLREGQAVRDCLAPDRIIIGVDSEKAVALLQQLYLPLTEKGYPLIVMDPISAELTKYAANAFLATKISFMNEMSQIAERIGANIHSIKKGLSADSRINKNFLNAGCGFGGSCFPKDISALQAMSQQTGYEPHILNAVLKTNTQQQQVLFHKISHYFQHQLKNKKIALWGLAFKPNTDDVRSASSRVLMEMLWDAGAFVRAYDPLAMQNISALYPTQSALTLCHSAWEVIQEADALAVVTEWDEFKHPDFLKIKNTLKYPVIFDGRNLYDRTAVQAVGLNYFGIGVSS